MARKVAFVGLLDLHMQRTTREHRRILHTQTFDLFEEEQALAVDECVQAGDGDE
jgi:hypothetical protein